MRRTFTVEAAHRFLDTVSLEDIEREEHIYQPPPQGGYKSCSCIPAGAESDDDDDDHYTN